ncbi:hypothetical protein D5H75_17135 [Bailinhaonella thermotolerans]|uniref:Uncharacterized protein n=2 Tax=Bailinhaonella thermotolerans TaxID=1070861 RepID=A0A3A4AV32_9ACTN|nr:hypothetical protein D5H75_17135 [Bailinhaonella thermotolerans]
MTVTSASRSASPEDLSHVSLEPGVSRPGRGGLGRAAAWLGRRWPTMLGLGLAALSALDLEDGREQGVLVFIAALIYLGTAVAGRPGVVWILFAAATVALALLKVSGTDPWPALVGAAIALAVVGLVSGLRHGPRLALAQIPAMALFGGAALLALALSPTLGACLVAAALMAHAALDALLWRRQAVVTRTMSEFCAALDLTLGLAILALTLT